MNKRKSCLWTGLLGALLSTLGGLAVGLSPAAKQMPLLFSSPGTVSHWQIGLCAVLGGLGMLLQYFGYHGIGLSFEDRENSRGRLYVTANRGFTIVGAIFHVLLCVFLYLWQLTGAEPGGREILAGFLFWFVLPFALLFFVSGLTAGLLMLLQIGGGHSTFARGLVLFNPLLLNPLLQAALFFLPGPAIVNGIRFAGTGITSLLIFAVFLPAS